MKLPTKKDSGKLRKTKGFFKLRQQKSQDSVVMQKKEDPIQKARMRRKLVGIRKYVISLCLLLIAVPTCVLSAAYLIAHSRPLYISPLPLIKEIQASAPQDDSVIIHDIGKILVKNGILYDRIDKIDETTYSILLQDKGEVLLTKDRDIASQLTSLQVILIRLTMEGRTFKRLDLRFEKPVITFVE